MGHLHENKAQHGEARHVLEGGSRPPHQQRKLANAMEIDQAADRTLRSVPGGLPGIGRVVVFGVGEGAVRQLIDVSCRCVQLLLTRINLWHGFGSGFAYIHAPNFRMFGPPLLQRIDNFVLICV